MLDEDLRGARRRRNATAAQDPMSRGSGGFGELLREETGDWLVFVDGDTVGPIPLLALADAAPAIGDRVFVHVDHVGDPAYAAHFPS
jgi:hypothetical protein